MKVELTKRQRDIIVASLIETIVDLNPDETYYRAAFLDQVTTQEVKELYTFLNEVA